ncbi:lysophospholipase II [Ustulina deusta]|nr:lysophospholipase II [Ustulina deusta]
MASDTTYYTVGPKAAHTQTVIFLHGRDSNCREFADELFESEASEPANQPRTLLDLFPGIRWVFPSAPTLQSERFGTDMSQWFDMWSVENPVERPELQHPGLHQSVEQILGVIKEEEMLVPQERIFLAGISQGFATAIAVFFAAAPKRFAGLIGLCSWMAAALRTEDFQSFEDTSDGKSSRSTPVFLGHSIDDEVVPIKNGRDLRDTLQSRRLQVEWREYEDGGHWVNEPQGVDDIARFINSHMLDKSSERSEGKIESAESFHSTNTK